MEFPDYLDVGKGPAVVFEHGAHSWTRPCSIPRPEYLAKRGYSLHLPQQPHPHRPRYVRTLGDLAGDTLAISSTVSKLDKVVLVRHVGQRLHGPRIRPRTTATSSAASSSSMAGCLLQPRAAGRLQRRVPEVRCRRAGAALLRRMVRAPIVFSAKDPRRAESRWSTYWVDRWATDIPARAVFNQGFSPDV